ncbi:MAG: type IV toxin-antitoxin system AbiEi family antitoxin [Candidatus Caenarcaniphilales bacterium]|nr:type IV toxin-antitoxin system AbiEi family antitoxin [Candidatus Caenarcaniphilales bacterium]
MIHDDQIKHIEDWTEKLLSIGKSSFSLAELKEALPQKTHSAIKLALLRLSKKKKILSIHKGYYLITNPQQASQGRIQPSLFVDNLMKYLNRDYYVGMLNAAAFHGSSHQQPQEFYIFTTFPVLRPTAKNGFKINYISRKSIPFGLLENKKTETGYLKISKPIQTAIDLIQFETRIGGLNRASTVINELAETIKPIDVSSSLLDSSPVTALQRLGYILEKELEFKGLADEIYKLLVENNKTLFRIPLKASKAIKGFHSDERWKVIVNTKIEVDE